MMIASDGQESAPWRQHFSKSFGTSVILAKAWSPLISKISGQVCVQISSPVHNSGSTLTFICTSLSTQSCLSQNSKPLIWCGFAVRRLPVWADAPVLLFTSTLKTLYSCGSSAIPFLKFIVFAPFFMLFTRGGGENNLLLFKVVDARIDAGLRNSKLALSFFKILPTFG